MPTQRDGEDLSGMPVRRFYSPDRVAQAVRTAALLAITGASIALSVVLALGWSTWLDAFLTANTLTLGRRHDILIAMAWAAFVFAVSPMALVLKRRNPIDLEQARRLALALSPLALLGLVAPLFRLDPWVNQPLRIGIATAIVVFLLEATVARALEAAPDRWSSWLSSRAFCVGGERGVVWRAAALAVVVAGALAYGAFVTFMTVRYHNRLGTAAFDLGGYDNIFYNALRGRPLRGTVAVPSGANWSSLRTHAEFSVYAFLPFYALNPRAEALLCIQAFVVGLAAVPIYLIAVRRLPIVSAFLLSVAYLLFAPVHAGNFYDFHFQPIASTLMLWCFYFIDTKKIIPSVLLFVVALGCREDVSISLAMAGVIMLATGYRPVAGFAMALVSAIYFVTIRFLVMPHFGTWWFQDMYKDLLPDGDPSLIGVLKTLASNPLYTLGTLLTLDKVLHVLRIFLPLAFLPLRGPCLWPGFVPAFLTTVLTTGYHPTTDTTFQYIFYWVPFIFVGSTLTLARILTQDGWQKHLAALSAMTLATVLTSFHWGVVFQHKTFASAWGRIELGPLTPTEVQALHDLRDLGKRVPPTASIALSETETPHFSNRLSVYALRVGANDADYILYRTDSGGGGADQAGQALASGHYEKLAAEGKFALLIRKKAN